MRTIPGSCFAIGLVLAPIAGRADVFPMDEGVLWTYDETFPTYTDQYSVYFAGTATIGGAETSVRHFSGGSYLTGLAQYWSQGPDGDVFIHGWDIPGTSMRFDPPIRYLDLPLVVGNTWSTTTTTPFGVVTLAFEVLATEDITVPAGTFPCVTIRETESWSGATKATRNLLFGTRLQEGGGLTNLVSVADGVGEVQTVFGVPSRADRLVAVDLAVAVRSTTWTTVRQLYR